jgi:hypothetical protein
MKLENSYNIEISNFPLSTIVKVGKYGVYWISQYSVQTAIDDYSIVKYVFSQKPTKDNIITAQNLQSLEIEFQSGRKKIEFKCWECGRFTHWLNVEGNLFEKLKKLDDLYCGC